MQKETILSKIEEIKRVQVDEYYTRRLGELLAQSTAITEEYERSLALVNYRITELNDMRENPSELIAYYRSKLKLSDEQALVAKLRETKARYEELQRECELSIRHNQARRNMSRR